MMEWNDVVTEAKKQGYGRMNGIIRLQHPNGAYSLVYPRGSVSLFIGDQEACLTNTRNVENILSAYQLEHGWFVSGEITPMEQRNRVRRNDLTEYVPGGRSWLDIWQARFKYWWSELFKPNQLETMSMYNSQTYSSQEFVPVNTQSFQRAISHFEVFSIPCFLVEELQSDAECTITPYRTPEKEYHIYKWENGHCTIAYGKNETLLRIFDGILVIEGGMPRAIKFIQQYEAFKIRGDVYINKL